MSDVKIKPNNLKCLIKSYIIGILLYFTLKNALIAIVYVIAKILLQYLEIIVPVIDIQYHANTNLEECFAYIYL